MSGWVTVAGLGPGAERLITPEVAEALAQATDIVGYGPYVERVPERTGLTKHASDNRVEVERASHALQLAAEGRTVAVVSGGDPGVFAMAAAVFEAIDAGPEEWKSVELAVVPGVTAMLAVAARIGAPLGHDFCAISLSDNLKPWEIIEKRLRRVAEAGLVIALYNPISKARPWQLGRAFEILRETLPASTPVVFGRAAGRPDERMLVMPLGEAEAGRADMATCVVIGSPENRTIARPDLPDLVYTPRFLKAPSR